MDSLKGNLQWSRHVLREIVEKAGTGGAGKTAQTTGSNPGGYGRMDIDALPGWADFLDGVMVHWELHNGKGTTGPFIVHKEVYPFLDPGEPVAFEEIFVPLVMAAWEKLCNDFGCLSQIMECAALAAFQRILLKRLSQICTRAMELEFSVFRAVRQPVLERLHKDDTGHAGTDIYREFVCSMMEGHGFVVFLKEYPVAARLMAVASLYWVEWVGEFLERLSTDLSELEKCLWGGAAEGKVSEVEADISDMHHRGRTVIVSTFSSGLKVVYKPRDMGMEKAFSGFLEWVGSKDTVLKLKAPVVINKGTYGWMEFIQYLPCNSERGIRAYYKRAGMLAGLACCLEGSDFHFENIIACGEHPVLIDVETLFHQRVRESCLYKGSGDEDDVEAGLERGYSVLRTGLLPGRPYEHKGKRCDLSGLAGGCNIREVFPVRTWKNVNTDSMKLVYESVEKKPGRNISFTRDEHYPAHGYIEDIVSGFRGLYSFLLKNAGVLLGPNSPLEVFKGLKCRFVFRSTRLYASLILRALEPRFLRRGKDRSKEFKSLYSHFEQLDDKEGGRAVGDAEMEAVEHMDVPYFWTYTNETCLYSNNGMTITGCFVRTAYQGVLERVMSFDNFDLERQTDIIRQSFRDIEE